MTDEREILIQIIRDEHGAAVAAVGGRVAAIEQMPDGPLRARLCAGAYLMAGYQMMALLEGDAATARQLRRIADLLDSKKVQH